MTTFGRRRFIQAVTCGAAAPVLQPFLRAHAATAPRKRLVIYVHGQSIHRRFLGLTSRRTETDYDLAPMLAGYQPIKAKTLIVDNLFSNAADFPFNHSGRHTTLTCNTNLAGVPTFDHLMAKTLSAGDPMPVLNLGIHAGGDPAGVPNICRGPDGEPYPAEPSPAKALARLFGVAALAPEARAGALAAQSRRRSVLDATAAEVKSFRAGLGGVDRSRLDQYLTSVEEVIRKADALDAAPATSTCASGSGTPALAEPAKLPEPVFAQRLRAQLDVAALALGCGSTHVVAIQACPLTSEPGYQFLGVAPGKDYHRVCHMEEAKVPEGEDWAQRVVRWHGENVAYLHNKLRAIPDVDGTVADHTVIVHISDAGGRHHSGFRNWPVIVVGDLRGTIKSGRFVTYANFERPLKDLFITLAHALGVPLSDFGSARDRSKGTLPGVLG